ncbi:MAG: Gfo/Idh/MocA family oxidoreductase [Candidatus Marinimicrobia bacterium]|nr:Gfo/Idh/MocA family oxidoreductase [Candidatus Neomarinimicrobiota bacterium]
MKNFALIGAAGYIAPRHMKAIKETGNRLVAALDPHDAVGVMDRYFFDVDFFTEFERFDRHVEKLRRLGKDKRIHYVSICSPNYLHDAHIRFALRVGADAICEKPMVMNPWNLDALKELEKEYGRKVWGILQLREHKTIKDLKKRIDSESSLLKQGGGIKKHDINLTYITPRGRWYFYSWKGDLSKSGGVATNIGIHFFDMLLWIFGKAENTVVLLSNEKKCVGILELERARVKWFLSLDYNDLPEVVRRDGIRSFRSIEIDGKELEFSSGFEDLHTIMYEKILKGEGPGVDSVRPSIELVYQIRNAKAEGVDKSFDHPLIDKLIK